MKPRVNSALIRRINTIRILHCLRENPGISQSRLGDMVGLDKATVSIIVTQLIADNVLERRMGTPSRRVGRPETALSISRNAGLLAGIRLEPDNIRIVLATLAGQVLGYRQMPGSRNVEQAIAAVRDGIHALVAQEADPDERIRGVGVGVPGLVRSDGMLVMAPNLGWHNVPIQKLLSETLRYPVVVDNDTKAAATAERLFGSCRTISDYIYLAGHSGIGGALILDGRIRRGTSGYAGELGHIMVETNGRLCGCGKHGCLEAYASASAILRILKERGRTVAHIRDVALLARDGDPVVCDVLDSVGHFMGLALAGLVDSIDPGTVVLGGTLAIVGEHLLPSLKKTLEKHTLPPIFSETSVMISPIGEDSVPMGGIALALEGVFTLPNLPEAQG